MKTNPTLSLENFNFYKILMPRFESISSDFTLFNYFIQLVKNCFASFVPSSPHHLTINSRNYKIIRKLGEGGFSFVFLVKDDSGDTFALKKIKILYPEHEGEL